MSFFKRRRLAFVTIVYWILLLYIIAALVFWFIELQQQNHQMTEYKLQQVQPGSPFYQSIIKTIAKEERSKTAQYFGEGSIFLLLILIGAIFVYRAVRRQIKLQQQQQNFMMAVTHELKTPIAVAKLNLETLLKYKLDEQKQQKIIHSALQETNRLNTLANNILVSAQLEGGGYRILKDELDFSALTMNAVNEFQNRFSERKWQKDIQPDLNLTGDTLLLQILLNNLLENAVKYSPKNGMIALNLKKEQNHIVLQVKDEVNGIPPKERKKVFEKFYRIGDEQTRTAQGTGLGLYLCKKIATDHKATISVAGNTPQGSIFAIQF
jgi:two-component system sensor histidine kinase CiaH